jgi:hypothetical protein
MVISSVAGEVCLVAASLIGASKSWRSPAPLAPAGFLLFAIAATLGALGYAGIGAVDGLHDQVSHITEWAGLALIAAGLMGKPWPTLIGAALLLAVAIVTGQALLVNVGALVLMIAWRFWLTRRPPWVLVVAALLFALAGLVIGTHGELLGLPRVDFYHLTLAVAILLIATA